jgi:hypothetical protein
MSLNGRPQSRLAGQRQLLMVAAVAAISSVLTADWIAGLAVLVLWAGWRYLAGEEGPPVLALAFTFQWAQIVSGIFYYAITRRRLEVMDFSDYRPMVLIALGCLVALLLGLRWGMRLARQTRLSGEHRPAVAFTWRELLVFYTAATALRGIVQELALQIPALTQGILALSYIQLVLLFLIFRRLTQPQLRWGWIGGLLLGEVVLGFTGYFAGFREPLMIAALALLEAFDRRKVRQWLAFCGLAAVVSLSGLMWMSIRTDYRLDFENEVFAESRLARLDRVVSLSSEWFLRSVDELGSDVDFFVDRLWAVYYPALAISRVPSVLPHEDGAILWGALRHLLTPRLLFPEKEVLESDSEMVRTYSGVWVAGAEKGVSIAFGYAAESYIDFGLPWMFIPVFVYGLLMGMAYQWFVQVVQTRELAVALVTVVFWLSLYLFERSWIRTLGLSATLMIYLGGAVILLDRLLRPRRAIWEETFRTPSVPRALVTLRTGRASDRLDA